MATLDLTPDTAVRPGELLGKLFRPTTITVHRDDFPRIKTGEKREVRSYRLRKRQIGEGECAIVYTLGVHLRTQLVVVSESWIEPLGAISPESWEMEGYASIDDFRAYFKARESGGARKGFRPLEDVQVVRFRPFTEADREPMATELFERFYGRWA